MTDRDTTQNHYTLLQVKPTASAQDIRRAYRDLSKLYHPDTTTLPPAIATEKFKTLNAAYATLSNPEKRLAYDYSIGISRVAVIQAPSYLNQPAAQRSRYEKNSAYLDPTDRPLSPGELFALFILGVTFVGCLLLVFTIGWTKGELVIHPTPPETATTLPPAAAGVPETPAAPLPTGDTPASFLPEVAPSAVPSQAPALPPAASDRGQEGFGDDFSPQII